MKKYAPIMLLVALFVFAGSISAETRNKQELIIEIYNLTKVEPILSELLKKIEELAQGKSVDSDPEWEKFDQEISQTITDTVESLSIKALFVSSVDGITTREGLIETNVWLSSELGRRFLSAEMGWDGNSTEQMANEFFTKLRSSPPPEKRLLLVKQFESTARRSDTDFKMAQLMMRDVLVSFSRLGPGADDAAEQARATFDAAAPQIRKNLKQRNIATFLFLFRDFTDEEMAEYIEFIGSKGGQEYSQFISVGATAVIGAFFTQLLPKQEEVIQRYARENS